VKEYLSQKNVAYTEYDVAQDKEKAREMVEKSKQMGVPVVIVDDDIVVGFNQAELEKLLAE
jgi:glutaredoxin 3